MKVTKLKIGNLEPNLGQIPGLPLNPRTWIKGDVEKIAKSLGETPELFEARPIIVYPYNGKYIIIGGNLRYEGAKFNGYTSVPCVILPEEMPVDKLKELVIKDNGSFGQWDVEELASMWKDLPLAEWGIPKWENKEILSEEELNALFERHDESKPKPTYIVVEVPHWLDSELIKEKISAAIKDFPDCKLK